MKKVNVIGGGLAGCEAAFQLAKRGIPVNLYEMRPVKHDEAHETDLLGELVCSNSFRGQGIAIGVGVLKEELKILGSLFMEAALFSSLPAGGALAVNRQEFSQYLTDTLINNPLIKIIREELKSLPRDEINIIATGPLSEGALYEELKELVGEDYCHFFDGAAPIVSADTLNYDKMFFKSRYDKGDALDYLNSPMTKEEYTAFYDYLVKAERFLPEGKETYFEGCMPFEVLAKRGPKTLLFGPLKPVGLEDPKTDLRYHAVLQLRAENKEKTMYNLVGCQTGLMYEEQKKLLKYIPGLENAEILRFGVVHRNSYLNAPKVLEATCRLKNIDNIYVAGQLSGVEGYVESAASGLVAGINVANQLQGKKPLVFPRGTMIGAMNEYITKSINKNFQPMNANFGLLPPLEEVIRDKKLKKELMGQRCLDTLKEFWEASNDL